MSERKDGDANKASAGSNPFLLGAASSANQGAGGAPQSSLPSLFGVRTSSTFTSSRNIFSGSSSVSPTSSRSFPITSLTSDTAFRNIEPRMSTSDRPGTNVGYFHDGKSGSYNAAPVFGGSYTSKSVSKQPFASKSSSATGQYSQPFVISSSAKQSVITAEAPFGTKVRSSNVTENLVPTCNVFGSVSATSQAKPEKSVPPVTEANVFGGTPNLQYQSSVSEQQVASPKLFGGQSSISTISSNTTLLGSEGTSSTTLFGGISSGTSKPSPMPSICSSGPVPSVFGGISDKPSNIKDLSSNVFGGMPTSLGMNIATSSSPRLFGGLPNKSLGKGVSKSHESQSGMTEKFSDIQKEELHSESLSEAADLSVFGGMPSMEKNESKIEVVCKSELAPEHRSVTASHTVFGGVHGDSAIIDKARPDEIIREVLPLEMQVGEAPIAPPPYPNLFGGVSSGEMLEKKVLMPVETKVTETLTPPPPYPNLFGGISGSEMLDKVMPEETQITEAHTATLPVSNLFGGISSGEMVDRKFGTIGDHSTVSVEGAQSAEAVSEIPTPNVFGGTTKESSIATTPNLFGGLSKNAPGSNITSVTSELKPQGEPPPAVFQVSTSFGNVSETIGGTASDKPPSSEHSKNQSSKIGPTSSSLVFGGPTTDNSHVPKLFTGDIFGGASKSDIKTEPSVPFDSGKTSTTEESGLIFDVSESPSVAPANLFGGVIPEERKSHKTESHSGKEKVKSQGNPTSQDTPADAVTAAKKTDQEKKPMTDQAKKLDELLMSKDLIDIFGKDDDKTPSSVSTSSSPPHYNKRELTKIIIAQIPDTCMDKEIIKTHFEKFGRIKRVYMNQKSNQATVQYEDHKGASKAKRKGQKIHPNLPEVKIFYATPVRRKSEDGTSDAMLSKKKAIKTLQHSHVPEAKVPSDIDPYVPLERPTVHESAPPFKYSKRESISGRLSRSSKQKDERPSKPVRPSRPEIKNAFQLPASIKSEETRSQISFSPSRKGGDIKLPFRGSPRSSPLPAIKTSSPRSSRVESPKAQLKIERPSRMESPKAQLKIEDRFKTAGRSISPAKELGPVTDVKNLKATLELQTMNSNDKHNVLKARDKLMRIERKKRQDIKTATSLDATCPDMCPEFERYMRDDQNDLSSYEITNGVLDHNLCVKKFSRSSADKDEPLPHELRPGPVLLKTMDYLVCNVMVLCDKDIDIGIWYNYLWDRTRAIRNDISQQQLIDETAVTIIERCVRFHIYTDVHLCEESSDVFDRKLNTENLTKSLQTLKELYKDLAEMGKFFSSEAEFRAYEMLLNLNNGEKIVHQYSQYRDPVQKSSDVIYALKVFLALKSNNFSRFFKLIRGGTYLQGCILHRYFPQVRSKALDTFIKAYIVSKQVKIPLTYMMKNMGFEDKADATSYLNYHGIAIDGENTVIDKTLVDLHPEGQPPVTKPTKLIESNRLFSVVEVIQGGLIPENPLHSYIPHDSFDANGYLRRDARDALDQNVKLQSSIHTSEKPVEMSASEDLAEAYHLTKVPQVPLSSETRRLSDHDYMTLVKETYDEVANSVVSSLSVGLAKESLQSVAKEHFKKKMANNIAHDLLSDCIKSETRHVCKGAYQEVEKEEKEWKRKELEEVKRKLKAKQEMVSYMASSLCSDYSNEVLMTLLNDISLESIQEVKAESWQVVQKALMTELPSKLIGEVVVEEAKILGEELLSKMEEELSQKVEQLNRKAVWRLVRDYFKRWRKVILDVKSEKQTLENFPASCSQLSVHEQSEAFSSGWSKSPSKDISLELLSKLKLEDEVFTRKVIAKHQLTRAVIWYPLPLQQEMKRVVEKSSQVDGLLRQYVKILLCPSNNANSTVLHWLRSKLIGTDDGDIETPLDYCFNFRSKMTGLEYGCCLSEMPLHLVSPEDLERTSAVLFLIQEPTMQDAGCQSMKRILKFNPHLPHRVICDKNLTSDNTWKVDKEDILDVETSEKLLHALLEMWEEHSGRMEVTSAKLNSFVSGNVASHYVQPSLLKQQERSNDGKSPFSPQSYISLYNASIQYLVRVICDIELQKLNWPPAELNNLEQIPLSTWNKSDVQNIENRMEQIKLPDLDSVGFMPWKKIIDTLYDYVGKVSETGAFSIELWSYISSLLNNTSKIFRSVYRIDFDNPETEIHILDLPWTELIYACVSYKLAMLPDLPVFYQPKHLKVPFTFPQDWWEACDFSDPSWCEISSREELTNPRKHKAVEEVENFKEAKVPKFSSELLSDLAKERERCLEFQRKLETTLEDDSSVLFYDESSKGVGEVTDSEVDYGACDIEPVTCSGLLADLATEKEKYEKFQKRLESLLDDSDDLGLVMTFKEY